MDAVRALDELPTPLLAAAATPYVALAGTANVVMQLSRPAIGYGVRDGTPGPASLFSDPRRRARTTVGYLAVATMGTAQERAAYRTATNASHRGVRSEPGARVPYNAFDPELQRWVGACLFRGFEDAYRAVVGPVEPVAEALLAQGAILGGMLQMPAELWPTDRAAFDTYWRDGLERVEIDDTVRAYLTSVIRLEYAGRRVPDVVVGRRTWMVTGFLEPAFRDAMHLPWSRQDQRRFDRVTRVAGAAIRRLPAGPRHAPFTAALRDVRARLGAGTPLFES